MTGEASRIRTREDEAESNAISVRIELQADRYFGICARHVDEKTETLAHGDIGDDTLQRYSGRLPMPHTFAHGASDQRQRWFSTGCQPGDLRSCDTSGTGDL